MNLVLIFIFIFLNIDIAFLRIDTVSPNKISRYSRVSIFSYTPSSNKYKLAREGEKDKGKVFFFFFKNKFRMKSSSAERDEFSVVA